MIANKQKDIARWAMEYALRNGCQSARVSIVTADSNSFEYRNKQLDQLEQSSENKLYIELFVNGKYGSFSTNRLEQNELQSFIRQGIKSTDYLAQDNCRQLPNEERYYIPDGQDLQLFDPTLSALPPDIKLKLARQAIDEIYEADKRIISISSSYTDGQSAEYMLTSNGFEDENTGSWCSVSVSVTLKTDGDARAESYWYDSAIFWDDLIKNGIAKEALERAKRKIGQAKIETGTYDMLLDNTVSARLLSPLIGAMYGSALQQKNSFLLDKLDQKIVSGKLTVKDTPHLAKAFGARWYDGEGVATYNQAIIKDGILKTYFLDTYNALKMGVEPTIASPSIINLEHGKRNFNQILKSVQKGIWVTGFNGGNTNSTTGDFSFGVEGFLVENGQVVRPISEMNITGNILLLWNTLKEVGNDPRTNSSWRIPSLLFEDVDFSGL